MTFNVIKDGMGRYKISIGIGKRFSADNLKEVSIALEHYFDNNVHWNRKKEEKKNCPLCDKAEGG